MDDKVRSALTCGVMAQVQDGPNLAYQCKVCDRIVSEPGPHIQGKDHYNNLIWYTLKEPSPSQVLLDGLPSDVRAAKMNKELELLDKSIFSYECLICRKKVSGIKPLIDHIAGKEHEKARKTQYSAAPQTQYSVAPQTQYSAAPQTQYSAAPQTQYSAAPQTQYSAAPQTQYSAAPQTQYSAAPQTQYSPAPQTQYSVAPQTQYSAAPQTQYSTFPHDAQQALRECVVESYPNNSFKCRACNKDSTGLAPLLEHLRSDKHKKKASQQLLPDLSNLRIGSPVVSDAARIGVGREDQVDGSWTFPWAVVQASPFQPPSAYVYRNLSMPRGLVLVFNYHFTGTHDQRHGSKRDSFNLKTLFRRMGYLVYLYEDFNKTKTKEALQKNQEDPFLRNYDSLIVFILSHGKDDKFYCAGSNQDEEAMTLDNVRDYFTDTSCPALKDKPKLFFANSCRGKQHEPHTQFDSLMLQQTAPKDMLTTYACINKFMAPRHPEHGTIFVQVLCEVLATHAHNHEVQDLHLKMCELMKERGGSTPEAQNYHFKRFYFNPVQP